MSCMIDHLGNRSIDRDAPLMDPVQQSVDHANIDRLRRAATTSQLNAATADLWKSVFIEM